MSGLIDVLSETGLRTGEVLPRTEIHRLGKRHRAVWLARVYGSECRDLVYFLQRAGVLTPR
jgi:hypothetical protein